MDQPISHSKTGSDSPSGDSRPPLVGIVMGSDSDWPVMEAASVALTEFGIEHEVDVVSAHRMPREMIAYGDVLTPGVMHILTELVSQAGAKGGVQMTTALMRMAAKEPYLALELQGRRYDIGVNYGLLVAQLALSLDGKDRDEVLSQLVELLAVKKT